LLTRLLGVLCAGLLAVGCQFPDAADSADAGAEMPGAPTLSELLEDPNMLPVSGAEVRRYFTGNTAYWEPLEDGERLYAAYYDPSGEQRMRERRETEATAGAWRFDDNAFCQTTPDGRAESCGTFVAGPDDVLVFCSEMSGCNWLVVGLNEGNSLSL